MTADAQVSDNGETKLEKVRHGQRLHAADQGGREADVGRESTQLMARPKLVAVS